MSNVRKRRGWVVIAALYVEKDGCYYGLPDVDPWEIERDDANWQIIYRVTV